MSGVSAAHSELTISDCPQTSRRKPWDVWLPVEPSELGTDDPVPTIPPVACLFCGRVRSPRGVSVRDERDASLLPL